MQRTTASGETASAVEATNVRGTIPHRSTRVNTARNPELTALVDLCTPEGTLLPAARGHTRRPLHHTNLRGWGRNKRWEYWGIITPTHVVGLTLSSLDYAAVHECYVLDRQRKTERKHNAIIALGGGVRLPDTPPPVRATARAKGIEFEFADEPGGTRLRARAGSVELRAFVEDAGDSLGVVVPWSERLFQYTVKSVARPVSGELRIDGVSVEIPAGQSWATLDRGRGRWPYKIRWNWAAGGGVVDHKRIGLQLGGKWTEGTGATENALFVDGVMHYIPDEVRWQYDPRRWEAPWRIRSDRVDVTLEPFYVRNASTNLLVLGSEVHQAFGRWSGWMSDTHGARHSVDGILGWAEQAENRW